jgi:hypothetical protein
MELFSFTKKVSKPRSDAPGTIVPDAKGVKQLDDGIDRYFGIECAAGVGRSNFGGKLLIQSAGFRCGNGHNIRQNLKKLSVVAGFD